MFLKKIRADKQQHQKSNFRLRKSRDTHLNNPTKSNHTIILSKQKNICENNASLQQSNKINEIISNNHDASKSNEDSYHNFNEFNEDLVDDFTGIYNVDE
jgi:hypothetical protein